MSDIPPFGRYATVRRHGFGDLLRELRRSRARALAMVDGPQRLTFEEFDRRVNRLTTSLRRAGVVEGERVLWLGQNSVKVMELLLACAKIGAIFCPANWRMSHQEIEATVEDLEPKVVVWQGDETGQAQEVARSAYADRQLWVRHDGDEAAYEALIAAGDDVDDDACIDPERPLLAIYTAAHSGRPGAALLSHTALLLQAAVSGRGQAIEAGARYLVSGPMFHVGVLMGAFASFAAGGCCVFAARPDAVLMARLIAAERITHGFIPQPLVAGMAETARAEGLDLSSLFTKPDLSDWCGVAAMPSHAPQRLQPGGYGQTEIMGMSVLAWLGGGAAGRPNLFLQVAVLDEAGRELPAGEVGEIAVRGPLVMCGYWRRSQENASRTRDGWHRTHDLGRRNEDGALVFVGPKTTMIKSGVENIYPAEVEACVGSHPAVAEVCIIGVPDPKWDQNVKALVVLRDGAEVKAADIIDHCRRRIASYKKPKLVEFVTALEKTSTGQVDRAAADRRYGGGGYPRMG